jgi:hypothetical protein
MITKVSRGVVPLAASVGFATSGSSSVAGRLASAAAGGAVGLLARLMLIMNLPPEAVDEEVGDSGDSIVPPKDVLLGKTAAAQLLRKMLKTTELKDIEIKKVNAAIKKIGITEERSRKNFFKHFLAEIVVEAVGKAGVEEDSSLLDLEDVINLIEAFDLERDVIGDGLAYAAIKFGDKLQLDGDGFYVIDADSPLVKQAAQIFFLADKYFYGVKGYYGRRIDVAQSYMTPDEYRYEISTESTQLFVYYLNVVMQTPDLLTREEFEHITTFLEASAEVSDFRPAVMQDTIRQAVQALIDVQLKPVEEAFETQEATVDVKFNFAEAEPIIAKQNLAKTQELLGWENSAFDATVEQKTMPIFQQFANECVDKVMKDGSKAEALGTQLKASIESLGLDSKRAKVAIKEIIGVRNDNYMDTIENVNLNADKGDLAPAYKVLSSYSKTWSAFETLTKDVVTEGSLELPGLPFVRNLCVDLYNIQLEQEKQGRAVANPELFNLSPTEQAILQRYMNLPKLTSYVSQVLSEFEFKDEDWEGEQSNLQNAQSSIMAQMDKLKLTKDMWASTALDLYYQKVQEIAGVRAIPSADDNMKMRNMAKFLMLDETEVGREGASNTHLELLGDKYVKAVTEAMTPTGVISEEYWDGLQRLRDRLGLSQEDAKKLLGIAARSRLGPVIKGIVDVWKSDIDPTKKAEKEQARAKKKAGDPISDADSILGYVERGAQKEGGGPNVYMREALNLVDFFTENYFTQGVSLEEMEKMPVNAVGIVGEDDLIGAYKHFVLTRLTEPDEELKTRYEDDERVFAMILGITPESQNSVKESVAFNAYRNMIGNILMQQMDIDARMLQQFGAFKDTLGLDDDRGDIIFNNAAKEAILKHASAYIDTPDDQPLRWTSQMAMTFRNQVQSLGFSFREDTGFGDQFIGYMYALEVQDLVESDRVDELRDLQEAYEMPEEAAASIVDNASRRYINQMLNFALRAAAAYKEVECITWTKKILQFAEFTDARVDANGAIFNQEDKRRLIGFMEDHLREEVDEEEEVIGETLARIDELIHLSSDYITPYNGIDGLMGIAPSAKDLAASKGRSI